MSARPQLREVVAKAIEAAQETIHARSVPAVIVDTLLENRSLLLEAVRRESEGHPAYRCQVCHEQPSWRCVRSGDVVVTWACSPHLADVLIDLQREWENRTEVVVTFMWEAA